MTPATRARTRDRVRALAGDPRVGILAAICAMAVSAMYLLSQAPAAEIGAALSETDWTWISVAVAISVLGTFARAASWHVVIRAALPEAGLGRRTVLGAYAAGIVTNLLLPGKLGEAARTCAIARRVEGPSVAPVAGTVLAHRLLDLLPIAGLAIVALTLGTTPGWLLSGMIATASAGAVLTVVALTVARLGRETRLARRIAGLVRRVLTGFAIVRRPREMALASAICSASWLLRLLMAWCAMLAFGVSTSLAAGALVLLVVSAARSVPLLPGGIGLLQVGVALALVAEGVGYEHGIIFGLGFQAVETLATAIFGASIAAGGGFVWLRGRLGMVPRAITP